MTRSVLPPLMSHWRERPEEEIATMALLARTTPARKLIALVPGSDWPAGKARKSPSDVGETAVMFTATAFAVDGIEQRFTTGKLRAVPEARAGPPETPSGFRVSARRHGVSV